MSRFVFRFSDGRPAVFVVARDVDRAIAKTAGAVVARVRGRKAGETHLAAYRAGRCRVTVSPA